MWLAIVILVAALLPATAFAQTETDTLQTDFYVFVSTGQGSPVEIPVTSMKQESCEQQQVPSSQTVLYTETYSVLVEVTPQGNARVIDELPPVQISPLSSSSQGEKNLYWRAVVTINYEYNNTTHNGRLTSVSGSWHGERWDYKTSIIGRSVYYNQSTGGSSHTVTPGINSWSYQTGFPTVRLVEMGCNSTLSYRFENGTTGSLYCNAYKIL